MTKNYEQIINNAFGTDILSRDDFDDIKIIKEALEKNDPESIKTGQEELQKIWILRKFLHPMDEIEAIDFMLNRMQTTKTNEEFFVAMKR